MDIWEKDFKTIKLETLKEGREIAKDIIECQSVHDSSTVFEAKKMLRFCQLGIMYQITIAARNKFNGFSF